MIRPTTVRLILCAAALPLLGACSKDSASLPGPGTTARAMFVHAVADTGNVDVRVSGQLSAALTGIAYGTSSGYQSISTGASSFSVQPSPSTSAGVPRSLTSLNGITVSIGAAITIVAAGEARDTVSGRAAGITAYIDDLTAPAAGQARLRVINASPDAGAVDVYATAGTGSIGALPTFAGVDYRSALSRALPAGSYTLTVTALAEPATVLATSAVTLPGGGVQTVVVRGYRGALPSGLPTTRRVAVTTMVNVAP